MSTFSTNNTKQIIPPIDKGIAKSIEDNLEVWPESWNKEIVHANSDLCVDPYDDVYKNYYNDLLHCSQHRLEAQDTVVVTVML